MPEPSAFLPESFRICGMAGLLAWTVPAAFPWQSHSGGGFAGTIIVLTVAGTAPDLNRFPF